jgi:hypothetical protein
MKVYENLLKGFIQAKFANFDMLPHLLSNGIMNH